MFEKLKDVAARYEQINEKLMDPTVVSDNNQYKTLMKEHKNLTPIVEKYREYEKAEASLEEAKELLEEGGLDKDFKEIVEEQMTTSRDEIERLGEELKILLLPKDPMMTKTLSLKSEEVPAAMRRRCSLILCSGCIPCTQRPNAGKQRF